MPTEEQLVLLCASTRSWNQWRLEHGNTPIDLSEARLGKAYLREANLDGADLRSANLRGANLCGASLIKANMSGADLIETNLSKANLRGANLEKARVSAANMFAADLSQADLCQADLGEAILFGAELARANLHQADLSWTELQAANLAGATLREANLMEANLSRANLALAVLSDATLSGADLSGADLSGADLSRSICVGCDFSRATLTGCRIHAMTCRGVTLHGARQQSLHITPPDDFEVIVDDVHIAQFISLVLENEDVSRAVTVTVEKLALILGRFTASRNAVLEALCDVLRERQYLPLVLNCNGNSYTEDMAAAVEKLARMSRLVVADLTGAASVREALTHIVPQLPTVVWQPVIQTGDMHPDPRVDLQQFPGVLAYRDAGELVSSDRLLERVP